jgi:nucleotide-binding universal stress UspA family protein
MMNRILIAVDDSAPALAAAMLAIEIGQERPVELHFVTVTEADRGHDQNQNQEAVLRHLASLATRAGLSPSFTAIHDGDQPFEMLLDAAHEWGADLIVMGRSDHRRPGGPYVGSQTEHLLEFTDIPVLVVPRSTRSATTT